MENINPTGTETSSCLRNTGKLGTTREMENIRSRDPGETWIALLATNLERKATIIGTVNAPLKPSLKRMWNHPGTRKRNNLPTTPLVGETIKSW